MKDELKMLIATLKDRQTRCIDGYYVEHGIHLGLGIAIKEIETLLRKIIKENK